MRPSAIREGHWSRTRWILWVGLAFLFQLSFIHVLSLPRAVRPRVDPASTLMVPRMVEPTFGVLTELRNPTLLSLGDAHGFQSIWMIVTPPPPIDASSKEEPAWLEVNRDRLGEGFRSFAQRQRAPLHGLVYKPAPQPSALDASMTVSPVRSASTFRVEAALSGREILEPPRLRSWPAADVLASSRVQITVDALGRVVSALLLAPGSGLAEADRFAVEQSYRLRFAPTRGPGRDEVAVGRVVYDWHLLPQTNGPAGGP